MDRAIVAAVAFVALIWGSKAGAQAQQQTAPQQQAAPAPAAPTTPATQGAPAKKPVKTAQKQAVRSTVKAAKEDIEAAANQTMFDTPDAAMHALADAMKANDRDALQKMFGAGAQQLLSGDPVEDDIDRENFSAAMQANMELDQEDDSTYRILVGADEWPTPIPIVKKGDKWVFDTQAGLNEILDRRVGNNELAAIATCRAYVLAQWEYYVNAYGDNDGLATYAQRFISTSSGTQDGLYWETTEDDDPSPMGKLIAAAEEEGYNKNHPLAKARKASADEELAPYHGYYVKILTRQGTSAPGGKYNYIINGNMIAGFAMVAFPATWGNSGVMTFIVNQQGRVYEKNLGPETDRLAEAMTEYNPDPTWKRVNEDVIEADADEALGVDESPAAK